MKKESGFWMAHVAAIKQEGISTVAYAKRHGLAVKSLYRWQRKLRATSATPAQAPPSGAFVALRVAAPLVTPPAGSCTLVLDTGMRLEMPALPAPAWLAALVGALQGAH